MARKKEQRLMVVPPPEATVSQKTGEPGRPGMAYYLNEAQAVLICIAADTKNAELVRKQVIDTFMAYRRGRLVPAQQAPAIPSFSNRAAAEAFGLSYLSIETDGHDFIYDRLNWLEVSPSQFRHWLMEKKPTYHSPMNDDGLLKSGA